MKKIATFCISMLAVLLSSCCFKCRECKLSVKYEWKVPHNGISIINMENDSLIFSEIHYESSPSGIGNIQIVSDSGSYIINKANGLIIDTLHGFVPESAENKYLHNVGKTTIKNGILFETRVSNFTVAENYHGYRIILQEWYKNIRSGNNSVFSVMVYKGKRMKNKYCLPGIYDFTYDKTSLFIYSGREIYKFQFDELIK